MQSAAVLLLPLLTGLNGIVWAEVVGLPGGPWLALCASILSALIVVAGLGLIGWNLPMPTSRTCGLFLGLTVLNAVTSVLWLYPIISGTRYVSLALIEGAWPVFSVFFGWLIFGVVELDLISTVGGALIIAGAALVFHKT